jgi:DNA polymerase-3 subunit delta
VSKQEPLVHLFIGSSAWTRGVAREMTRVLLDGKDDPLNPIVITEEQVKADPGLLHTELTTVPMFGNRPVVWIREAGTAALKQIESLVSDPEPSGMGVLVAECEALPPGSSLAQMRQARLSVRAEPSRGPADVVLNLASEMGIRLDTEAVAVLLELTGGDRGLLVAEVRKLADYAVGQAEALTGEDVIAVCADVSLASIDQVIAAALHGHTEALIGELSRARETGASSQQISAALVQRLFRELRSRGNRGSDLSDEAMTLLAKETFQLVRDSRSSVSFDAEAAERLLIRMAVANARGRGR